MRRIRTFIAIELTRGLRDRLTALQQELASAAPGVKWVESENLHVTLQFLGEVDDRDIPAVCRAVQGAVGDVPAFAMSVEGLGCFPNTRRPRVLWIGTGRGTQEVVAIHDALDGPLQETGCYRREERRYTPHVTLGRLKGDVPGGRLGPALAGHQGWKAGELTVAEIHVMGSELTPQGPVYTVLSRAKLS
jgi:2'-5' RNA ligase